MQITPALKGQLTKALKAAASDLTLNDFSKLQFTGVRSVFGKHMPREQAKHATKRYLATK